MNATCLILVVLSWIAPGDDANVGTAAGYDLRVSTEVITEGNWDTAGQVIGEPIPSVAGTAEECTVGGLDSNTVYYFAIKAVDEAGNWSELSNVVNTGCDTTDVMRFDLDCSAVIDISDVVTIIEHFWGE
jgi:hypothetical protein